jgi:hypothetical protein
MVVNANLISSPDLHPSFFWWLLTEMEGSLLGEEQNRQQRWAGGGLAKN